MYGVKMKMKTSYYSLVLIWFLACAYVLFEYYQSVNVPEAMESELYTIFFLKMSALSLPLGPILISSAEVILGAVMNEVSTTFIWLVMVISGFFQWGIAVPWIFRRLSQKISSNNIGRGTH